MADITVYPDHQNFVDGAAAFIAGLAAESIAARGRFTIALAGGGTPRPIYARLAAADHAAHIDWGRVTSSSATSVVCRRTTRPATIAWPARRCSITCHFRRTTSDRMRGEDDPGLAALAYEQDLQGLFRTSAFRPLISSAWAWVTMGTPPRSFPGTAALRERERWVVAQLQSQWRGRGAWFHRRSSTPAAAMLPFWRKAREGRML